MSKIRLSEEFFRFLLGICSLWTTRPDPFVWNRRTTRNGDRSAVEPMAFESTRPNLKPRRFRLRVSSDGRAPSDADQSQRCLGVLCRGRVLQGASQWRSSPRVPTWSLEGFVCASHPMDALHPMPTNHSDAPASCTLDASYKADAPSRSSEELLLSIFQHDSLLLFFILFNFLTTQVPRTAGGGIYFRPDGIYLQSICKIVDSWSSVIFLFFFCFFHLFLLRFIAPVIYRFIFSVFGLLFIIIIFYFSPAPFLLSDMPLPWFTTSDIFLIAHEEFRSKKKSSTVFLY